MKTKNKFLHLFLYMIYFIGNTIHKNVRIKLYHTTIVSLHFHKKVITAFLFLAIPCFFAAK